MPDRQGFDHERIVVSSDAAFEFESMSPARPAHWRLYWKRAVRYGRRRYEFQLLGHLLNERGMTALPVDITELYAGATSLKLQWAGLYTLTNFAALREMRRIGAAKGGCGAH